MVSTLIGGCSHSQNLVMNPGFESGSEQAVDKWKPQAFLNDLAHYAYGISDEYQSGRHSLKISNLQEGDAWVSQDVPVKEGRTYKLSGWIKTDNVQSLQGKIGATLCIAGSYIRTTSLKGTQPWTQVECYFKTGGNKTSVPIACRLGFTNSVATGTAWFDDIELRETRLPTASNLPEY